jgi:hypothetical protein
LGGGSGNRNGRVLENTAVFFCATAHSLVNEAKGLAKDETAHMVIVQEAHGKAKAEIGRFIYVLDMFLGQNCPSTPRLWRICAYY